MTYLTVEQYRAHKTVAASDEAIQDYIDAAEADIDRWCGAITIGDYETADDVTETHYNDGRQLLTPRMPIAAVTTVTDINGDTETELLEDDDWRLERNTLVRAGGYYWGQRTVIVYTPANTAGQRKVATLKLVDLELNQNTGLQSEGAAGWQETHTDYAEEKRKILWDLCPPPDFA